MRPDFCIQRRRRSCTARMTIGARTILGCRSSTFSAIRFWPRLSRRRRGDVRRVVQSGSERQGTQGDPADRPILDASRTQRQVVLDDLAKMFNPIIRGWINYYGGTTSQPSTPTPSVTSTRSPGTMGTSEVQVSQASIGGDHGALAGSHRATPATPVRPLGPASGTRLNNGSRMRRESLTHGLCERPGWKLPRATPPQRL